MFLIVADLIDKLHIYYYFCRIEIKIIIKHIIYTLICRTNCRN